jgi:hypothetical protein
MSYAARTPSISGGPFNDWVIAGMYMIGLNALDLASVDGWRVIGNEMTCPQGSGQSACFHSATTTNLAFYGNYVHNVGDQHGSIDKYYHGVYFTTNSNHIDAGWNTIINNPGGSTTSGGCRAMQFYSTGGSDQYDLHVHDNLVHDSICDGLNFSTVNPNNGTVEAYNNVVYHVGTGPDPANGSSSYTCVNYGTSSSPTTPAQLYNNTLVDCGPRANGSSSGVVAITFPLVMRNNISYSLSSGEPYFTSGTQGNVAADLAGSNNLWYGNGNGPSQTTSNVNADPQFVNLSGHDYHLQSTSPAKDAGVTISGLLTDIEGVTRPQGSSYDIGAYEYH